MNEPKRAMNPIVRYLLFALGWLSLALGFIGIFLPLLPTTPFIILAAVCFAHSSERFYTWLISHPRFGPMIADFLAGKGLPIKAKRTAIVMMWFSILFACLIVNINWPRVVMLVTAAGVSVYIWRLPTPEPSKEG